MTSERFGELLRRSSLLETQNAIELEELIGAYPWCGPLRTLRYRKAVLDDAEDVDHWRIRAQPFLPRGAVRSLEDDLQGSHTIGAEVHSDSLDEGALVDQKPELRQAPILTSSLLSECILTAAAAVDTAGWFLHRNGLTMELGHPRPTPIEEFDSYKRWKRRRVSASWDELLMLGISPGKTKKKKRKKRKSNAAPSSTPEVASETLAELLAAQGHSARAIEMYEQLGLRYPDKKDTFAARVAALQQLDA